MKPNYLVLVMATVRFDAYNDADTPNFDSINIPIPAHSPTCVSSGSMFFYLHNVGPITEMGRNKIVDTAPYWVWLSSALHNYGYYTFLYTTYSDFYAGTQFIMREGYDVFHMQSENYTHCTDMFCRSVKSDVLIREPFFCVLHVLDTHKPYWKGDYIRSIERVDSEMGKLFKYLKNTNIVITSDNGVMINEEGDFYGDKKIMKDNHRMNYIAPELFRIPLVKGYVE